MKNKELKALIDLGKEYEILKGLHPDLSEEEVRELYEWLPWNPSVLDVILIRQRWGTASYLPRDSMDKRSYSSTLTGTKLPKSKD